MPVYTVHAPPRNDRHRDDDTLAHTARLRTNVYQMRMFYL